MLSYGLAELHMSSPTTKSAATQMRGGGGLLVPNRRHTPLVHVGTLRGSGILSSIGSFFGRLFKMAPRIGRAIYKAAPDVAKIVGTAGDTLNAGVNVARAFKRNVDRGDGLTGGAGGTSTRSPGMSQVKMFRSTY